MRINGMPRTVVQILREVRGGKRLTELVAMGQVGEALLREVELAARLGIVAVTIDEGEYPPLLKSYGDERVYPPLILFRLGAPLGQRRYVAVAGARDASPGGLELAREVGRRLAVEGYVVVTGLAKGIDEAAVMGALESGGVAVGVAPYLYEREGVLWYRARRFLESGRVSVVSERLRPSSDVRRDFVLRNRIIAGMSLLVVIPEARYREGGWGTRYQVDFGIRAGRTVVIFKPPVDDEAARRAYRYFQEAGARTANSVEDVLEILRSVETGNLP
ncbi:MAG: DNA-processing protein DprA [Pyrobaculum sp.]